MARKLRLEFAGACYHVTNRGNYRRDLFAGGGAARSFLCCLDQACTRYGWLVHAFVIMRNHFHLAVETPEPNLSDGMKWLQGTWAMRFNRFRRETGRPFQGRYKAGHLEKGHGLAQVAHYIHLNPVRAKIIPVEQVGEYRWSSLAWLRRRRRPAWLIPSTVLHESGGLADTPAGWRAYPTMLNIVRDEANSLSPHFFDLVVIDESHRSIYNTYGEVLDYFHAIKLGLTATPRDVIDHNTFAVFNCEDGLPSFAFSYDEAVNHVPPYLCEFRVLKIKTKFQDEGISKRTISLEDQKKLILDGKDIEEIVFDGTDLEKTVTNHATNALIVKEFMEESIKDPNGVLRGVVRQALRLPSRIRVGRPEFFAGWDYWR